MRKTLFTFATIVFVVFFVLAIYYGVNGAKEIVIDGHSAKESFNFGLFLINFLKWAAYGLIGGGILLSLANREI